MKHWFITTDGNLKARWKKAFPEMIASRPDVFIGKAQPNDVVWLSTTVESWSELIGAITAKGAIVVVLSYSPDDREALRSLDLGARGYVHTLAAPEVLQQVAVVVTNQGVWVGQELLAKVLGGSFKALQQRAEGGGHFNTAQLGNLTDRERGVALAVVRGATNKEVARQLDITERTVKAHLTAIFKKLAVRDRLQLILKLAPIMERVPERF
ncbi:response regulator transcription factor [Halomonas sp. ISL-60]|uniref:response regulator transcription factor n=1 Tax=unclassified Halomonas TaxID=2609666 RepID=UPI0007DA01E6|nr:MULTISPECIES: response regulator transcription factor [unclassified Halomonas]MBT2773557.1 response regulator transcription factor [Halomonas sp. ISL-60]MBT2785405.1 response regulator transcription factor [Halomonas sp. ISL-106]MBT2797911.1 response regulator transcription factor [Halomonas sp. ISL-104]MBT2803837.1 response regulator transcription factor [Halomonas sp. ISL-56]OAL59258.1 helix-turn-helix transcriptional regulator [Halomonas sp. ALS9]